MADRDWKRIKDRLELRIPIRVYSRETLDFVWNEVTRLTNVTPFGAAFTLKHPTEKGRLLQLTIPMPRPLRVFDHLEDQYKVWAIVRYVRALDPPTPKGNFDVGVAFIGKRAPKSYEQEPWKRYEIATPTAKQMASVEEILKPIATTDQRVGTRHAVPIEMEIETISDTGAAEHPEATVTENISRHGANILTTMNRPVGRFIRLRSAEYNLVVHAAIRSQTIGVDGIGRIHVEFIDQEWPL